MDGDPNVMAMGWNRDLVGSGIRRMMWSRIR